MLNELDHTDPLLPLFHGWVREINTAPIPELLTIAQAMTAIRAGRRHHRCTRLLASLTRPLSWWKGYRPPPGGTAR